MAEQIYKLIGDAMREIRAVGKDSVNQTQGFKYRGIDAVMNALNPVMSKLGLFIVPEVLEQTREERESVKTYNNKETKTLLKYSILKIKYTLFAPDGSNVSCVVIGEGMDSGDKASNKAMAVGLKYACFQVFMIPTEEMAQDDPDKESFEVTSAAMTPPQPATVKQRKAPKADPPADVEKTPVIPNPENPVATYLAKEKKALQKAREITVEENADLFTKQLAILRQAGKVPNKGLSAYTQLEAEDLIAKMYTLFDPLGTVLKDVDSL